MAAQFRPAHHDDQASGVPAMLVMLCGLIATGGAAMIASGVRTRVVLHEDAIEVFGIYRGSRLARSEILGRRVLAADQGGSIILVPRYTSGTAISLPASLAMARRAGAADVGRRISQG